MFQDLGLWSVYDRVVPEDDPTHDILVNLKVVWMRNAAGDDWYDFYKTLEPGVYATVAADGRIVTASDDPSSLVPAGHTLVRLPDGADPAAARNRHVDLATGVMTDTVLTPLTRSISAAQAKVALLRTKRGPDGVLTQDPAVVGAPLLDAVDAVVATYPRDIQLWYADAREWQRGNPYVAGIALELNLTESELDGLFTYASTLVS